MDKLLNLGQYTSLQY